MFNRHINVAEIELKHVFTGKTKGTNIVNTNNFFLPELDEIEKCSYRVKTANAGMGLQWFWHILLVVLF